MNTAAPHLFHIPVMGLGFTIDTPLKVARFGISSVLSIVEDELLERMREFYCKSENLPFKAHSNQDPDFRAKRITSYLDLLDDLVKMQIRRIRTEAFVPGTDITQYFDMLPEQNASKKLYLTMLNSSGTKREELQQQLRALIQPGNIDVNIMTKVDKMNYDQEGAPLPLDCSDALAALRGFAKSVLASSVVFSAGLNPRLYSYCEAFDDFFPSEDNMPKKKIILKVSDYRSALIQGKFLAKKGLWVSEFRVESGLNCGGHAFATEGLLMGPILEEFKTKRKQLQDELFLLCNQSLQSKGRRVFPKKPALKITAQGGLGTHEENQLLLYHYQLDSVGWGSPFLLVPEATNLDEESLQQLAGASPSDYYLSHASPLGVPLNNFRKSSSETQRKMRIEKNRPGSPCYKKYLSSNTEFTEQPICTASRQYQHLKIKQLLGSDLAPDVQREEIRKIEEKDCLCEGLGASALLKNKLSPAHNLKAISLCPGPNLAYFSGTFSLREMVDHIYGRANLLNQLKRPHVFINELQIYMDYFKNNLIGSLNTMTFKKEKQLEAFIENLSKGISYYKSMPAILGAESTRLLEEFDAELTKLSVAVQQV
jgi:hypothetical protein